MKSVDMREFLPALIIFISLFCTGCSALWFAGGAATGAAVSQDMEDGELIDD